MERFTFLEDHNDAHDVDLPRVVHREGRIFYYCGDRVGDGREICGTEVEARYNGDSSTIVCPRAGEHMQYAQPTAPKPERRPYQAQPKDYWTAETIKALRTKLGLSQSAFAQRVGVTVTAISHWETGRRAPDFERRLILDKLSIQIGEGVAGTSQPRLLELIAEHGAMTVCSWIGDFAQQVGVGLGKGIDLTNWRLLQGPGAVLLYQLDRSGAMSDAPRVLVVNAPESERAKWEAVAADSVDTECAVVCIG